MTNIVSLRIALASLSMAACSPTAMDKRPPCGTGSVTTLAANQSTPRFLAMDSGNLYWTNFLGGELMSVPQAGGKPRIVASELQSPMDLAVDDVNVYLVVGTGNNGFNQILAVDKASGASTVLVDPGEIITSLRIDDDRIYWGGPSEIKSLSKHGDLPLTTSAALTPYPLGVDDKYLYAREKDADSAWLSAVPKLGGDPRRITWTIGHGSRFGFDMNGTRLYFSSVASISSVIKDGSAPLYVAPEELQVHAIAVGDSCVYWTSFDDAGVSFVRAASKTGEGEVVTIVEGASVGSSMVVDASGLYWTDPLTGTISSVSR